MNAIRAARLRAGLTQAELAELAGTARSNIAAYESGAKTPSEPTLRRILDLLRPRPSKALEGRAEEVRRIVAAHRGIGVHVIGSVAKGRDIPGSDLDLLVELGEDASLFDLVAMEEELSEALGIAVDVISTGAATDEMRRSAVGL